MPRSPLNRLRDIGQAITDIRDFVDGIDQAAFLATPNNDRKTFKAVSASLLEIGEAVKDLPKEIIERHENIPWRAIAGMRDHVAHEYFQIDVELVWNTIENGDLDSLLEVVEVEIERLQSED